MDEDFRTAARKQFFKYFRIWFIIIGILAVVCAVLGIRKYNIQKNQESGNERGNYECSTQRVFDNAEVLTKEEEEKLAELIEKKEREYEFDILVVTIKEDVESRGDWEYVMMNLADDIYDQGNYGYDKVHGDGILLLDNWYSGQAGTWLSTCGNVYVNFSSYDIDDVLTQVDLYIEKSPYQAYEKAIECACRLYRQKTSDSYWEPIYVPVVAILVIPLLIALIYAIFNSCPVPAKDTTTLKQYVKGGKEKYLVKSDTFLRKNVTSVKIDTGSGSSGGGRSSGGYGGGHVSSGGVSHGGGGHRR